MGKSFKSQQGQLLLDGGKLAGSVFHRTVVLISQHDPEGAFGLVLNRPSGSKLADALVADLPEWIKNQELFVGGPVQSNALSYLHSAPTILDANVMAELNIAHSLDTLIELGESFDPDCKIKIFGGYAGWSPGQLDDEIKRQAWLIHPASLDLVFSSEPENLWRSILRKKGWKYRLLAESPDDPASN